MIRGGARPTRSGDQNRPESPAAAPPVVGATVHWRPVVLGAAAFAGARSRIISPATPRPARPTPKVTSLMIPFVRRLSTSAFGQFGAQVSRSLSVRLLASNWCDAAAYCIWAGGYMCRSNEGDATHPIEWKTACASPSGNKFPYGPTYLANHCVDASVLMKPTNVATYPLCQSSYAGVYDMSGNVSEWLDCGCELEGTDPTTTKAFLGGGAYHNVGDDLDCTPNNTSPIGGFRKDVGSRCCYDP